MTASGSKRFWKIIVAPDKSATLAAAKRPWAWKTGSAWISRSSEVKRQQSIRVSAFDDRFLWVSIAPLERPVVPDV